MATRHQFEAGGAGLGIDTLVAVKSRGLRPPCAVGTDTGPSPLTLHFAGPARWNRVARANATRRAVDGAFQVRYHTDLTVEDYVCRKAWWDASPPLCPYHRQGGCRLVPHGSHTRNTPEGVRVRYFLCLKTRWTVSLLPDCLAAYLPGTLLQRCVAGGF